MTNAKAGVPADQIIDLIAPLVGHQRHKWAAQCQAYGLSMLHFQVLAILDADGPTPMSRLAEQLDVGLSNATGIVGRLEERGVVVRVHDETDRRMVLAQLTPDGVEMLRQVEVTRLGNMRQLVEMMSPDEQQTVLDALRLLAAAKERYHAEHSDIHLHSHAPVRDGKETVHA
jgi:DNA-binding MarR family transcriptional regulator